MNDVVVTLAPWSPWPLVLPGAVMAAGIVLIYVGVLREIRWVRDIGLVTLVGGGLALLGLFAFLSGTWDQEQRRVALIGLGYRQPTFSGGTGIVGGTLGDIDFAALRDGESVTGILHPLGGDQWAVIETP